MQSNAVDGSKDEFINEIVSVKKQNFGGILRINCCFLVRLQRGN